MQLPDPPSELKYIVCVGCIAGCMELRVDKVSRYYYYCSFCNCRLWIYEGGLDRCYRLFYLSQIIERTGRKKIIDLAGDKGNESLVSYPEKVRLNKYKPFDAIQEVRSHG